MNKILNSGAIWPVVRKVLVRFGFALVAMVVVVYAMAEYKTSTGWAVEPSQEVANLFSLLWGFVVTIVSVLLLVALVALLGVTGVRSIRKGGGTQLVFGLLLLGVTVGVLVFGGRYVFDFVEDDSYRSTWYLPAFFVVIGLITVLGGRRKSQPASKGRVFTRGSSTPTPAEGVGGLFGQS